MRRAPVIGRDPFCRGELVDAPGSGAAAGARGEKIRLLSFRSGKRGAERPFCRRGGDTTLSAEDDASSMLAMSGALPECGIDLRPRLNRLRPAPASGVVPLRLSARMARCAPCAEELSDDATDAGGETSPAAIETRCGVMRDGVSSDGVVGGVPAVACVGGDDSGDGVPLEDVAKSFIRTLPLSAPPTSEVVADGHMWSGSPCAASGMAPRVDMVLRSEGNVVPLEEVVRGRPHRSPGLVAKRQFVRASHGVSTPCEIH